MPEHRIGTEPEWRAERDELLKHEKELTRRSDELARKRLELPWVQSRSSTASRPPTASSPWPNCSTDARSC